MKRTIATLLAVLTLMQACRSGETMDPPEYSAMPTATRQLDTQVPVTFATILVPKEGSEDARLMQYLNDLLAAYDRIWHEYLGPNIPTVNRGMIGQTPVSVCDDPASGKERSINPDATSLVYCFLQDGTLNAYIPVKGLKTIWRNTRYKEAEGDFTMAVMMAEVYGTMLAWHLLREHASNRASNEVDRARLAECLAGVAVRGTHSAGNVVAAFDRSFGSQPSAPERRKAFADGHRNGRVSACFWDLFQLTV